MALATFGAGCFWHVEAAFSEVKWVLSTAVGYMGGDMKNPSYENVCSDETGHAEVVQVEYDPKQVSYGKLLDVFWTIHDPTTENRQGPDVGTQYRSVIFYHTDEQRKEAEKLKEKLQKKFGGKIVTAIVKVGVFYKAEEYHQKYFKKHKNQCF